MDELYKIIKSVKVYLETDKLAGIDEILHNKKTTDDDFIKLGRIQVAEVTTFEELQKKAEGCKDCPLYRRRTNLVFGSGNQKAKLMFIGEAPGQEEDLKGEPFVGRADQLLT
ncbi:MAG: uracil-DNA glycosylase, partial [Candidatus Omnitrophica bacterium]|nr:uracil-DNA glycosylase [Candidatus Omnitrophota bacterium]